VVAAGKRKYRQAPDASPGAGALIRGSEDRIHWFTDDVHVVFPRRPGITTGF